MDLDFIWPPATSLGVSSWLQNPRWWYRYGDIQDTPQEVVGILCGSCMYSTGLWCCCLKLMLLLASSEVQHRFIPRYLNQLSKLSLQQFILHTWTWDACYSLHVWQTDRYKCSFFFGGSCAACLRFLPLALLHILTVFWCLQMSEVNSLPTIHSWAMVILKIHSSWGRHFELHMVHSGVALPSHLWITWSESILVKSYLCYFCF